MKQARKYHGTELKLPSTVIGGASELQCAADLLRRGVPVYRALTQCSSCDLVIDIDGNLVRVEVRSAKRNGGGQLRYPMPRDRLRYDVLALVEPDGRVTYQPDIFNAGAIARGEPTKDSSSDGTTPSPRFLHPLGNSLSERRVYRRELLDQLGFSVTWFRTLQRRGTIPPGHRDVGGKREWFNESEAEQIRTKIGSAGA